ncbi:MAG: hypothetical protein K0Q93_1533, partial [Nocardioidaceae bacterium]|nr:hypothetical protein [Nocardioidaceae bacterium]
QKASPHTPRYSPSNHPVGHKGGHACTADKSGAALASDAASLLISCRQAIFFGHDLQFGGGDVGIGERLQLGLPSGSTTGDDGE